MPTIALVDDDTQLTTSLQLLLERAGHVVVVAGDGLQGEALIRAQPVELFVSLRLQSTPQGAELSVADDGPGFADEVLPRAFERFYSARSGGSGIGLALVRAVAEAHGGDARAFNADGGVVCVRLVAAPAATPDG